MRRTSSWRGRAGFSLSEVVIALGIVSFGVLAVIGIFSIARRLERSAREDLVASLLARQLETELRLPGSLSDPDDQITPAPGSEGRILDDLTPLPATGFGSEDTPLVLAFDDHGRSLGSREPSVYVEGTDDNRARYLLAFWGEVDDVDTLDVQIRIEVPAAAAAGNRRRYAYWCCLFPR